MAKSICEEINCPFAKINVPKYSYGCSLYSIDCRACHLVRNSNTERKLEILSRSNEYLLYGDVNLEEIKIENKAYLQTPELVRKLENERETEQFELDLENGVYD